MHRIWVPAPLGVATRGLLTVVAGGWGLRFKVGD